MTAGDMGDGKPLVRNVRENVVLDRFQPRRAQTSAARYFGRIRISTNGEHQKIFDMCRERLP